MNLMAVKVLQWEAEVQWKSIQILVKLTNYEDGTTMKVIKRIIQMYHWGMSSLLFLLCCWILLIKQNRTCFRECLIETFFYTHLLHISTTFLLCISFSKEADIDASDYTQTLSITIPLLLPSLKFLDFLLHKILSKMFTHSSLKSIYWLPRP